MFQANGTPVTGEFLVNTSTPGTQDHSSITALSDGNFVVAWEDLGAGDGNGSSVKARLFHGDGTAASGEFQLNTLTTADQDQSSITASRRQ